MSLLYYFKPSFAFDQHLPFADLPALPEEKKRKKKRRVYRVKNRKFSAKAKEVDLSVEAQQIVAERVMREAWESHRRKKKIEFENVLMILDMLDEEDDD